MQLYLSKIGDFNNLEEAIEYSVLENLRYWILFGEDQGQVSLFKEKIISFYVRRFKANIVRLQHNQIEVAQIISLLKSRSLFGGWTLVIVDDYPDSCNSEWEGILSNKSFHGRMLIVAETLKRGNKMRRITEQSPHIGVINCYAKSKSEIREYVEKYLRNVGVTYEPGVCDIIVEFVPADMLLLKRELEKLQSYVQDNNDSTRILDIETLLQLLWDTSELELNELCAAFVMGDLFRLLHCLEQVVRGAENFVLILRVIQNYLTRIIDMKIKHKTEAYAIKELVNDVNFRFFGKARNDVERILETVTLKDLRRLLLIAVKTESECKRGVVKDPNILLMKSLLCGAE